MQPKPIFNKRHYKAHAGITISKQASDILHRSPKQPRSENELRGIRSVIAGLKDIHKNFEFVKTALGHALTYELYESDVRIEKQTEETQMSCFYILSGSVEAFYTVKNRSRHHDSEERIISSTNVAGDYIGLLSADGANFDFPPPEFMNTIEHSEFLRIDRAVFHEKIREAQRLFRDEIVRFLDGNALFGKITEEDRQKLVLQMVKQEFPAGKQILSQGQKQEHAFFIAEGRCAYHRRLYLPEQKRSELFKMGHVEKGSYFDASCIIDDQSSKFSVSAVGPVTCYLLNKWTIKNSESLLRALTVNRPLFPTDREIECLIKESDQWQSYKRDTVCDAFEVKHKTRIVRQNDIPRTLDVAIKHGTLLRQQRRKELITSPTTDDLDPSWRKSRGSTPQVEETPDSANTVLKAVMLMKRSRSSIQLENPNDELESNSSTDQKNGKKLDLSVKREGVRSAPNLKRQAFGNYKVGRNINTAQRLNGNKQKHPNTRSIIVNQTNKNANERNLFPNRPTKSPNQILSETSSRKTSARLETPTHDRPRSSPIPYERAKHKKPGSEFDDRWVAKDKKFKVKEIVNTRIPGKDFPEDTYRRFEPSMFEYIDKVNNFEREKAIDPFAAKLKAMAWLRQAKERLAAGGSDYNPGQSPLIVIEEFCVDEETVYDEENGYESHDQRKEKVKVRAGSLETLLEDSDKENVAEQSKNDEWRTAVHETRYEAERCLERAKTDIATLERQLVKLGWTRDMLVEKERKRNERRKRSSKTNEEKMQENIEQNETEIVIIEKQPERKRKTLKRQGSIQKILEDRSKTNYRRNRRYSDGRPDVKRGTLIKRYSTGTEQSAGSRPRTLKARTHTIS